MQTPRGLYECLSSFGQQHLLDHWQCLTSDERAQLARQIDQLDFELIASLVATKSQEPIWVQRAAGAEPPPTANRSTGSQELSQSQAAEIGNRALAAGQVAAILVAGGQGTRLGFDLPKGMLPIGPISQRTLFEILVDKVRARGKTHGVPIPLLIMTSPATHDATVKYFRENRFLGLHPEQLEIFCQGTMPAVDLETGQILLSEKHQIFLSPDGHGGMLQALVACGALERLMRRGIKHLFYGQIDNPLTQLCDPPTLGYHVMHRSEMTTQVVRKHDPLQRVGNVVLIDGRVQVIEYSDLPESLAEQRNPDGQLRLWAGNIAVHVFDLEFLDRVKDQSPPLPFHRAVKKVPFIDQAGRRVTPEQPNAVKFERFIFDLLPNAQRSIVVEIDPADGFAAVKNALETPTENMRTAQTAMIAQHTRWLRECGATVGTDVPIEIHPLFALDAEQLRDRIEPQRVFDRPAYLSL